jgi:hypothetical protein
VLGSRQIEGLIALGHAAASKILTWPGLKTRPYNGRAG